MASFGGSRALAGASGQLVHVSMVSGPDSDEAVPPPSAMLSACR
ncbi:hypothetical protein ACFWFI_06335 [Streptomyces sp. NPDC060209]